MQDLILEFIGNIAFTIGMVGVAIIIIGVLRGLYHYMQHLRENNFHCIRYEIGSHLILGLDFLVAKDILYTLLLDTNNFEKFWIDLTSLTTVIAIRIVLTVFLQKEMIDMNQEPCEEKPKKRRWFWQKKAA